MNQPQRPHEVRIGLVLYGGVSLAVYINGVAQEFFRTVKGHGVYRLLKALLDADIVVDVISGTSAGGLNGLYLGYALCNPGMNFLRFSDLWREHGDIGKLMRQPGSKAPNSVLDGEHYYQQHLEQAFASMRDKQTGNYEGDVSPLQELDLFITSTDFYGSIFNRFDDTGHLITVKDHRSVFKLKYREGRSNDFQPKQPQDGKDHTEQMARLARMTSCFPVAFPPVPVTAGDKYLRMWGGLDKRPDAADYFPRHFIDGGVLDNKPFSYTTGAIFGRTANRKVTRKLFYVEPVPEVFGQKQRREGPDVLSAGVGALTEIPGYESIKADLETIQQRNSQLQRMEKITGKVAGDGEPNEDQKVLYQRTRIYNLVSMVLECLFQKDGCPVGLSYAEQAMAPMAIRGFFDELSRDGNHEGILRAYDLPTYMRRLMFVAYRLAEDSATQADYDAWETCNRWIKCIEILEHHVKSMLCQLDVAWYRGDQPRPTREVWSEIARALDALLEATDEAKAHLADPRDQDQLTAFHMYLKRTAGSILDLKNVQRNDPAPVASSLVGFLRERLDSGTFLAASPVALQAWNEFPSVDRIVYPLQSAAGCFELDKLDVIRVSPLDARFAFSNRKPADKLAGDQLANFGGFFKRSWRSNDILWGRLDGMCRIFEALLPTEVLQAAARNPARRQECASILEELGPRFAGIAQTLADAADPASAAHAAACRQLESPSPGEPCPLWLALVEAAQQCILEEKDAGVAMVLADSIQEQIEWNAMRSGAAEPPPSADALPPPVSFRADNLCFTSPDKSFIGLAAMQLARQSLDKYPEYATAAFRTQYQVGAETIAGDVPEPVLVEIAARASLVLRDCLVPLIQGSGLNVAASPVYKFGFNYPVRLVHGFSRLVRYAPSSARVVTALMLLYSLAALWLAVSYVQTFVWVEGSVKWAGAAILILAPVAFLSALPTLLTWEYPRHAGVIRSYRPLAAAILLAGLAVAGFLLLDGIRTDAGAWVSGHGGTVSDIMLIALALLIVALPLKWIFGWIFARLKN